jgi:di/tricarboxylate transporter
MNAAGSSPVPDRKTPYKLRMKRTRRWKAGVALMLFGAVMALVHVFEHAGALTILGGHADDLFLGWPMAGLIVVAGAVVMGA